MGRTVGGSLLRSRLLVGVAAAAMAVPLAGKANAQTAPAAAKWSPWVEAGGMVGTRSFGDVDIFLPLWQDQGSLLFGDLRGTFSAQPTEEGNFGIGYRTQISPEWILGGYGYFDIANSVNDNLFYQVTLGIELKSVDWDFRVNGYIPINPDGGNISNNDNASIHISGNSIQMQTESQGEKALYGFDGEVGWRVPLFPADGDFDVRLYAGGYYFTNSDVDTIAGPRGRIEARLYDIDFLGLQSRLTAQGVVQWDSPRGIQGFGGLELRIPLGAITGAPGPKLNPLDRRMVDRVQRDIDVITEKTDKEKKNEDVIVDELTVSTHTIVFANGGGTGSGKKGDPTDLNNVNGALNTTGLNNGTGSNAIILVDGSNGNVNVNNPFQLLQGQALIGGGSIVPLTGAKTGKTVNFSFSGSTPTLVGAGNPNNNLVEMAFNKSFDTRYQNEIFGVIMDGSLGNGFQNGVHGVNMYRAIVKDSTITSAFANGIFLENVSDGAVPQSSFVHIEGNVISDNGENGILIATNISPADLNSHTQTIIINDNTINDNGFFGGRFDAFVSGSNPGNGIYIVNRATSFGSVLSQSLAILDNVISHNAEEGIRIHNEAREDGFISQAAVIDPNTITNNGNNGIFINNIAYQAGLSQDVLITDNFISGNSHNGIEITNFASFAGIYQRVGVYRNVISHNGDGIFGGDGVQLNNFATNAGIFQRVGFRYNTIDSNDSAGIFVSNFVGGTNALIFQGLYLHGDTLTNNRDGQGFGVVNYGSGSGADMTQGIFVSDAVITHNDASGIYVHNGFSSGASLVQEILVDPSTITDNGGDGIHIHNDLSDNGTFQQHVVVLDNTIVNNERNGIYIETHARSATIFQGVTIAGNTLSSNDENGIKISSLVSFTHLNDTIVIDGNQISNNDSRGVYIRTRGRSASVVNEAIYITGNTINENNSDGIKIAASVHSFSTADGSSLNQRLTITGNSLHSNDDDGIQVGTYLSNAQGLSQNVNISNNTIDGTDDNGIQMRLRIRTAGVASTASVTVSGNSISHADGDGIYIRTRVSSATLLQSIAVNNNALSHISDDGIFLSNRAGSNGTLSQNIAINDNTLSFIGDYGIKVRSTASGVGAFLSQQLVIDPNTLTHVGSSAIYVSTHIHQGANGVQDVTIDGNVISDVSGSGVKVRGQVGVNSTLTQGVTITNNSLYNLHGFLQEGIFVTNAVFDGQLTQAAVISNNSISLDGDTPAAVGILESTSLRGGGIVSQGLTISGNTIDVPDGDGGIVLDDGVGFGGGTLSQVGTISNNTITGGSEFGLASFAFVSDSAGANISQTFLVTGNNFSNNFDGVFISASAAGNANTPKINGNWTLAGNTITNTPFNGVGVNVHATSAAVTENVFLSSAGVTNTIAGNNIGVYGQTSENAVINIDRGNNNLNGNATTTFGNANFTN